MQRSATVLSVVLILTGVGLIAAQRGMGPGPAGVQGQAAASIGLIVGRIVDAGTGQPVGEAEVTVTMRAPAPPAGPAGATPFLPGAGPNTMRLLTGADGRFVIRDLPAGNVQLTVKAAGYVAGSHGQTRPNGPPVPIVISPDNKVVSSSIRVWKHAVLSGAITDERNEPAVNVLVQVMARTYRNGQARFSANRIGRTDDRGMYRIAGLAPGDYVVMVPQTQTTVPVAVMDEAMQGVMGAQGLGALSLDVAAGLGASSGGMGVRVGEHMVNSQSGAMPVLSGDGRIASYVTQYHPAGASPAEATVLTLVSGEERTGVDVKMPLVAAAKISGTVIGPDGPIANVQVRLLNAGDSDGEVLSDVARGATSANGSFQMFGVPAGQYVLKVTRLGRQAPPPGLANIPQYAALMGGRGAGPISPSDALTLFADMPLSVERDVSDLVITLSTGATVSGRVEFAGTATYPPLTGVSVNLTGVGGVTFPTRASNVSDDGRFVTSGAAAGKYFIAVSGRTPGWFAKSAIVNGIDALDQPFELSTENIANVVVTFTDRQTTVSGTVTDISGAPAEGTVIVFPAAYREWVARGMSARLLRNVRAQAKGAFSITGLPARDYLILALPDDQVPDVQNPAVFEALSRAAVSLTLSDGDTRTMSIKLAQGGR